MVILVQNLLQLLLPVCLKFSSFYLIISLSFIGDVSGQIHFEGYQVSNQCTALVKSKILLPTYDASELGYIKETSSEQYVPDVYYKVKKREREEKTKCLLNF
jgi:nuclear protein localization family protein 4